MHQKLPSIHRSTVILLLFTINLQSTPQADCSISNKNYCSIFPPLMNRSFDYVMRASINNSKSKQTHLFSQAKRFKQTRPSNCKQDSYDLSKTMIASTALASKSTLFPRQQRFKDGRATSPSPDAYHHRSFTDLNRQVEKGNTFGTAQKLKRVDKNCVPGPGAYQELYNPEKKLLYTMRSRVGPKDHSSKLGPGQYYIDGHNSVANFHQVHAKFNNTKNTVIGKDKRFKQRNHITPGPGPTVHSTSRRQVGSDPQYSFGGMKKDSSYIKKNIIPGPGSYIQFSQFAELRKGSSSYLGRSGQM